MRPTLRGRAGPPDRFARRRNRNGRRHDGRHGAVRWRRAEQPDVGVECMRVAQETETAGDKAPMFEMAQKRSSWRQERAGLGPIVD